MVNNKIDHTFLGKIIGVYMLLCFGAPILNLFQNREKFEGE
jgi:hypothetical protein